MFKKLIVLMLAVSVFTVNAQAASSHGLKAAFDELNFALTVEWDQKNPDFKLKQVEKFNKTLHQLQAAGMTQSELVEFIKAEVKDERIGRDLETAFNMIMVNKMSASEANNYILETVKNSYSQGASWNGKTFLYIGIGVAIVALAILVASTARTTSFCEDFRGKNTFVCDYYCPGGICYDDCYWTDSHCGF